MDQHQLGSNQFAGGKIDSSSDGYALISRTPARRFCRSALWLSTGLVAGIIYLSWLGTHRSTTFHNQVFGISITLAGLWLVAGPLLIRAWHARLEKLAIDLEADPRVAFPQVERPFKDTLVVDRWTGAFLIVPLVLVTVAYLSARNFLHVQIGLPPTGATFVGGLIILWIGTFFTGWGMWSACRTLVLSTELAEYSDDFAPFGGVPSISARHLVGFCFAGATLFGIGAFILLPAMFLVAWESSGLSQLILEVVTVLVVAVNIALLAWPAYFVSRKYERDRQHFLEGFSAEIDQLAFVAKDIERPFSEENYRRLRALLELRVHVVTHSVAESSVAMVKRIPIAVIIPLSTAVAGWVALIRR